MFNIITAFSSVIAAQHTSPKASTPASRGNVSSGASTAAPQGSTTSAGTTTQTSAQIGGTSASTANTASAAAAPGSAPSVAASSTVSASAAGVASLTVGASAAASAGRVYATAQSAAAETADLDRHFAIGMQKSAGAYAFDQMSDMVAAGPDAFGVAASLESSQKRFQSLVSQIATSGALMPQQANDDQNTAPADGSSAPIAVAQSAYADNAA